MLERADQQPETSQRRSVLNAFLTGAAAASWAIPALLLLADVRDQVFNLILGLAMCVFTTTVLVGIAFRIERRQYERRLEEKAVAEARAWRNRDEALMREQAHHEELVRMLAKVATASEDRFRATVPLVKEIRDKVLRDYFGVYSDVLTDLNGGPEVVNGETTGPIETAVNAPVVQLRGHNHRRS